MIRNFYALGVLAIFLLALAPGVGAYGGSICSSNGIQSASGDCEFIKDPTAVLGCQPRSFSCMGYPSKYKNGCVGYNYYDYTSAVARIRSTYWNKDTKRCEYVGGECYANIEYNSPKCGYAAPTAAPVAYAKIQIETENYPSYTPQYTVGTGSLDLSTGDSAFQSPAYVGRDYSSQYQSTRFADNIENSFNSYYYDHPFNTYDNFFNTYANTYSGGAFAGFSRPYTYSSSNDYTYSGSAYTTPSYAYSPSYSYPSYSNYPNYAYPSYSYPSYSNYPNYAYPSYSYPSYYSPGYYDSASYQWSGYSTSPSYYAYYFKS